MNNNTSPNSIIPQLMPGAEPFLFKGGTTGCLCLHGITATPHEVRWFGEHLAAQGHTVYGPRAVGHGVDHRLLRRFTWQDWYLSALDGYHLLRGACDRVVVTGLSMGGLLALLLAASVPVDGLIVMAAPLELANERQLAAARWIKYFRRYYYLPDASDFPERLRQEQAARGEPVRGRVRYDTWATQAIEQLYDLMAVTNAHLRQITAPTLLIYAEGDQTVPFSNLERARQGLSRAPIETLTVRDSDHILTQDRARDQVFAAAADFVRRYSSRE